MSHLILIGKVLTEIIILWYVIYITLLFIKGTRAAQLLKGLIILIIAFLISQQFEFRVINWVLTRFFGISIVALLVIFQPELRRALARLGQFGIFQENMEILSELADASILLSGKKIGALIAIEREGSLKPYADSATVIDAFVTKELILSIFERASPIHDGGIVIQSGRIAAAGCLVPLSDLEVSRSLGTRHRAAMGLTEETDAVVVVVSEETGDISVSIGGRLTKNLDSLDLLKVLKGVFSRPTKEERFKFIQRVLKKGPANEY